MGCFGKLFRAGQLWMNLFFVTVIHMLLDDRSFLDAIASAPDDDGIRLMYADFLGEKGDADSLDRSEFIRVQCALEAMKPEDFSLPLQNREAELLGSNWRSWLRPACQAVAEPLPTQSVHTGLLYELRWFPCQDRPRHVIEQSWNGPERPYLHSCQFRRGFLSHVALVAKRYRSGQHVSRLWERLPLDGLSLLGFSSAEIRSILSSLDVTRMRYLEIGGSSDDAVAAVVACQQLGLLRELAFRSILGTSDVCGMLGSCTSLHGLQTLVIAGCNMNATGLIRLLNSPVSANLDRLVIACSLPDEAAQQIVREFPADRRIPHLDLSVNQFSSSGDRLLRERFGDSLRRFQPDHSTPMRYYR